MNANSIKIAINRCIAGGVSMGWISDKERTEIGIYLAAAPEASPVVGQQHGEPEKRFTAKQADDRYREGHATGWREGREALAASAGQGEADVQMSILDPWPCGAAAADRLKAVPQPQQVGSEYHQAIAIANKVVAQYKLDMPCWERSVKPGLLLYAGAYRAAEAALAAPSPAVDAILAKNAKQDDFDQSTPLRYAQFLAWAIWRDHYKAASPDFEIMADMRGVLSQIDNMVCGWKAAVDAGVRDTDVQAAKPDAWKYRVLTNKHTTGTVRPGEFQMRDVWGSSSGWMVSITEPKHSYIIESIPLGPFALPSAVPEGWREALHQAVSAIYFDDSSDFKIALWNIVRALAPEWVDELADDSKSVFDKSRAMLAAAPAPQGEASL